MGELPIIGAIISNITGLINKWVPDKDLAAKISADVEHQMLEENTKLIQSQIESQAAIVIAEAKGESYLQRNWRPITMLVFVYIIAHNFIFVPLIHCFYTAFPVLEIPPDMWALLKLGIGGYVVGRTVEKSISNWKAN